MDGATRTGQPGNGLNTAGWENGGRIPVKRQQERPMQGERQALSRGSFSGASACTTMTQSQRWRIISIFAKRILLGRRRCHASLKGNTSLGAAFPGPANAGGGVGLSRILLETRDHFPLAWRGAFR